MKKRHEQKLILLSITLILLLNAPIILLFEREAVIFGIPVLYFAVFSIWLVAILLSYLVLKKNHE